MYPLPKAAGLSMNESLVSAGCEPDVRGHSLVGMYDGTYFYALFLLVRLRMVSNSLEKTIGKQRHGRRVNDLKLFHISGHPIAVAVRWKDSAVSSLQITVSLPLICIQTFFG